MDGIDDLSDAKLLAIAVTQLDSRELAHYQPHRESIIDAFKARLPTIRKRLAAKQSELASRRGLVKALEARYKRLRWRSYISVGILTILVVGLSIGFVFQWPFLKTVNPLANIIWPSSGTRLFVLGFVVLIIVCSIMWSTRQSLEITPRAKQVHSATRKLYSAESELLAACQVEVAGALRATINELLAETVALVFPRDAPALVELDSAQIVESETVELVRTFITEHSASAIGIAGPRGIGKSTILRAITAIGEAGTLGVYVHCPVKYDSDQFVRRLFEEVLVAAREQAHVDNGLTDRPLPWSLRPNSLRLVLALLSITLGTSIIVLDSMASLPSLSPLQITGGWTVSAGGILLFAEYIRMVRSAHIMRRARRRDDPKGRVLEAAWTLLRWRPEVTATSKTVIKPFGNLLEASEDDATKESAIERTHAELVGELRRFLRDYRRAADLDRIIVSIDELDKLSNASDLIDAINGLKDLFHIEGVHFVVSVSNDALDSFALRGVPARDAFDSSFDTIVSVRRLTAVQSLAVLRSRSTGFPAPLALFCHAWSGGLPRDLLRTARQCVEQYSANSPVTQALLVSRLVRDSAERSIASYARSRQLAATGNNASRACITTGIAQARSDDFVGAAETLSQLAEVCDPLEVMTLQRYLLSAQDITTEYAKTVPFIFWNEIETDATSLRISDDLAVRMAAVGDEEIALLAGIV